MDMVVVVMALLKYTSNTECLRCLLSVVSEMQHIMMAINVLVLYCKKNPPIHHPQYIFNFMPSLPTQPT